MACTMVEASITALKFAKLYPCDECASSSAQPPTADKSMRLLCSNRLAEPHTKLPRGTVGCRSSWEYCSNAAFAV